ncbi:MAG: choice-of-anchor D domain-containing protein [Terriglobales bacterium]
MRPLLVRAAILSRLVAAVTVFLIWISTTRATQLTIAPVELQFARVSLKHTRILSATITNSGSTSVTVSSITKNAPGFRVSNLKLPLTLHAGKAVTFTVTFAPTVVGPVQGNITFLGDPSGVLLTLNLRGVGVVPWALHANPPSLDFGAVPVGKSRLLPVALTNLGTSSITVSQDSIEPAGFSILGLPIPLVIAGGHSFTFDIKFTSRALGPASSIMKVSNPTSPILRIPVSATAVPGLTITPTSAAFGNVVEGTSLQQTGTLGATGANVTVSSATINNPRFVLSGLTFPVKVHVGQSVPFKVTFSPVAVGPELGALSFVSNAGNSPKQALTGTGISPYTVRLSWTASTSQVAGYNVYRREGATKYQKINSSLVTGTKYTDRSVTAGTTYYYETKAVDSSGQESLPSNRATAVVP